jgi:hypothetical protein
VERDHPVRSARRIYDWAEKAVRQLVRAKCDADAIILYASQTSMTELVRNVG